MTDSAVEARIAVTVIGDGNCLPRTGSVLAFGNEMHHEEMRLRIVVEMAINRDTYLEKEYLTRKTAFADKEANNITTFALFSDNYMPGDILSKSVISRIFEAEAIEATKLNSFMGIWQLFALSSVLKCSIRSVYPQQGNLIPRLHLDRLILPREVESTSCVTIMWTSTRKDMSEKNWTANHFVPILPVALPANEDLADDIDVTVYPDMDDVEFNEIVASLINKLVHVSFEILS